MEKESTTPAPEKESLNLEETEPQWSIGDTESSVGDTESSVGSLWFAFHDEDSITFEHGVVNEKDFRRQLRSEMDGPREKTPILDMIRQQLDITPKGIQPEQVDTRVRFIRNTAVLGFLFAAALAIMAYQRVVAWTTAVAFSSVLVAYAIGATKTWVDRR